MSPRKNPVSTAVAGGSHLLPYVNVYGKEDLSNTVASLVDKGWLVHFAVKTVPCAPDCKREGKQSEPIRFREHGAENKI